jgi:hypothetical protein
MAATIQIASDKKTVAFPKVIDDTFNFCKTVFILASLV